MKAQILMMLVFLSGCGAKLHDQIFEQVHRGDSEEQVLNVLGRPLQTAKENEQVTIWVYSKRADTCAVSFQEEKVLDTACKTNPNYVNPLATALQGMGKGLKNSSNTPDTNQTCYATPTGGGYVNLMNCH